MLLGRTIQGVGGGGVILLNDIIITDLVPMRLRGAYFGVIGGVWALGSVSGPVIGGALADKTTWVSSCREGWSGAMLEGNQSLSFFEWLEDMVGGTGNG